MELPVYNKYSYCAAHLVFMSINSYISILTTLVNIKSVAYLPCYALKCIY